MNISEFFPKYSLFSYLYFIFIFFYKLYFYFFHLLLIKESFIVSSQKNVVMIPLSLSVFVIFNYFILYQFLNNLNTHANFHSLSFSRYSCIVCCFYNFGFALINLIMRLEDCGFYFQKEVLWIEIFLIKSNFLLMIFDVPCD